MAEKSRKNGGKIPENQEKQLTALAASKWTPRRILKAEGREKSKLDFENPRLGGKVPKSGSRFLAKNAPAYDRKGGKAPEIKIKRNE
jgi:hypothetical protein